MANILKKDFLYNENKWGKQFNFTNEDNQNEEIINGFIIRHLNIYKKKGYINYNLQEAFKEDFIR